MKLTECEFLQRAPVRLRVHEVHEQELKRDPAAVDREVLPADRLHRDRVDVDAKEASQFPKGLLESNTHGTLREGEQLDKVGVGERVVSDVVAGRVREVEEQRCKLGRPVVESVVTCVLEFLEADGHAHEDHDHGAGGEHEHPSATETCNNERNDRRVDQAPAVVRDVDARLGVVARVADELEEQVLVVREESVAAHLGEETKETRNQRTATHTGGPEKVEPAAAGLLHLELDGRSDLRHFCLDEYRVGVTFGVVLYKHSQSLLVTILADQPPRALWQEEHGADLKH